MTKEIHFIKENPMGFLSTVDEDGHPRVRAWGSSISQDGEIFFGTSKDKQVFKQLKQNPSIEWITKSKTGTTLRVSGKMVFITDPTVKNAYIDNTPFVKKVYGEQRDSFQLFTLHDIDYNWFEMTYSL